MLLSNQCQEEKELQMGCGHVRIEVFIGLGGGYKLTKDLMFYYGIYSNNTFYICIVITSRHH